MSRKKKQEVDFENGGKVLFLLVKMKGQVSEYVQKKQEVDFENGGGGSYSCW